jgi:branched-chain amino acid transport system substrate-binding protein
MYPCRIGPHEQRPAKGTFAYAHENGAAAWIPDGTVIGDRGLTGEFIQPGVLGDWYLAAYQARYGESPIDVSFAQALLGLKAAYEKASQVEGAFPSTDQVISAFEYLVFPSPGGQIHMTLGDGHQAIAPTAVGLSRDDPELGKVTVTEARYYSARCVNPPPDMTARDWITSAFPGAQCD